MTQPIDTSTLLPPETGARHTALEDLRNRKSDAAVSGEAPRSHASERTASSAKSDGPGPDDAALRKAAAEFESLLVQKMFESMRKSARALGGGGALGQEFAEGMLDENVARRAGETGGIGLASVLLEQWGVSETEASPSVSDDPRSFVALREAATSRRDLAATADTALTDRVESPTGRAGTLPDRE